MLDKIKNYQPRLTHLYRELQDVRTVGLLAFLVIALMISWSGIKVIETNYGLQKDITRLKQQTEVSKLENQNLKLQNEYYNTDEYLELEARKNFGLAAPGETVVVVPKNVAMKYTVPEPALEAEAEGVEQKSKYRKNFDAWVDFLFHRNVQD